jgi:4-carboxymuconolactone decarboxylase
MQKWHKPLGNQVTQGLIRLVADRRDPGTAIWITAATAPMAKSQPSFPAKPIEPNSGRTRLFPAGINQCGDKPASVRERKMKKWPAALAVAALVAAPPASRAEEINRFTPLKAEELTPPQKAWADMIAAPPRNAKFTAPPYRAYIRNPDLAPKLSALSEYLRWHTSLPPRLSELAILITARQWTAQYEWFAHYPLALKGGLDPKVADAIAAGQRPDSMKDDEAALYDLATALYRDKKVSDPVYKAALEQFGERGIMDIIGIIGYYDITSMTLITMQAGAPNDSVPPLPVLAK